VELRMCEAPDLGGGQRLTIRDGLVRIFLTELDTAAIILAQLENRVTRVDERFSFQCRIRLKLRILADREFSAVARAVEAPELGIVVQVRVVRLPLIHLVPGREGIGRVPFVAEEAAELDDALVVTAVAG